jgi:hypothetical protein
LDEPEGPTLASLKNQWLGPTRADTLKWQGAKTKKFFVYSIGGSIFDTNTSFMDQRRLNNVITRLASAGKRTIGSLSAGQTLASVVVVIIICAIQGEGW